MLTRGGDYAWVRPALHAKKLRDLELLSGQPARRGQRGAGYEYNLTKCRQEERKRGERAEAAYRRFTEGWTKRSEEHTSELQSLMRSSYAVFCLKKKKKKT